MPIPDFLRRRSKFGAVKHVVDGVTYHSKKEAAQAEKLSLRKASGEVISWDRQVRLLFVINEVRIAMYIMDFVVYRADGVVELIEVKGMMLPDWKIKWRLLEAFKDDREWRTRNSLPKSSEFLLVIDGAPNVHRWVNGERAVKRKKKKKV